MDSDRPNRPEGSHDPQSGQSSGSTPPGQQPPDSYPPQPQPYPQYGSQPQPQQPTQPYGAPPPQGGYSQPPQYSDRPGSQPAQPQQGGYYPPQYSDQPQYPPQQPYYGGPPPNQINTPPKKGNSGLLFGLIGLLVLLIAGGAIWFFVLNKGNNPLGPGNTLGPGGTSDVAQRETAAASMLPKNTLGYISLATEPTGNQKSAFDKIGEAFESQPGFKEAMDRMTQQATGATGGQANETALEVQGLINKYTKQVSIAILPPQHQRLANHAEWRAGRHVGRSYTQRGSRRPDGPRPAQKGCRKQ